MEKNPENEVPPQELSEDKKSSPNTTTLTETPDSDKKNLTKKTYYHTFTENLKKPECEQLRIRMIKEFQSKDLAKETYISTINEFISDFEIDFQKIFNFNAEIEYENGEAIEGIVTKALYDKLISLYDEEKDENLEFLLQAYDFVELNHFESNPNIVIESSFNHALKQLQKMDTYKTPRDKLISIINCCMVWQSKKNETPTGADEFLPVLIYIVLKAKPKNPFSNIQFIRSPMRLRGLEEYYFTAYQSALEFIEKLEAKNLKIDIKEFEEKFEMYSKIAKENFQNKIKVVKSKSDNKLDKEILKENKEKETEMIEITSQTKQKFKTKINEIKEKLSIITKIKMNKKDVSNLTVLEIPEVLNEHKNLVASLTEITKKIEELEKINEEFLNPAEINIDDSKLKKSKKYFGIF